jgi:hypothetical protein
MLILFPFLNSKIENCVCVIYVYYVALVKDTHDQSKEPNAGFTR